MWARFARIGKGSSCCCPSLHADLCPPPKTMRPHQPQKKSNLFWRNRVFFPVASRSNPRCSKVQIASYLAQIRRFLAPTAWASSTSTTKKISPPATQAWFRKVSRRFWACFFWAMVGKSFLPLGWQYAWCFGKKKGLGQVISGSTGTYQVSTSWRKDFKVRFGKRNFPKHSNNSCLTLICFFSVKLLSGIADYG